jgi:hypothetical protein
MDRVVTIFDRYKRELLTFTARLGGKDEQIYLLDELLYDEHELVDYQKLAWRLRKLPAVLAFYITMKKNAEAHLGERKEIFDAWYGQVAAEENEANITAQINQAGPASMKKPLTIDQLKALVQNKHKEEWAQYKDAVKAAQERVDLLSAMYEGLKASIDMARSEERLVNTLLSQGLEQVRSNSASPYNAQKRV